jgi:hypothetical protein
MWRVRYVAEVYAQASGGIFLLQLLVLLQAGMLCL